MREIRTSGLMSGDGKRGGTPATALVLDSTTHPGFEGRSRRLHADIVAMKGRNLRES